MKRILFLLICLLISNLNFGQIRKGNILENILVLKGNRYITVLPNSNVRLKKRYGTGADLILLKGSRYTKYGSNKINIVSTPFQFFCTNQYLEKIDFKVHASSLKDFWEQQLRYSDAYQNLLKEGMQSRMREELNQLTISMWKEMEMNDVFLNDPILDAYLSSLLQKIYPGQIAGRPGSLRVKVIKEDGSSGPNAFASPNGYICVNTWLLSILKNEEELMGILAHELTHYMLDHRLVSIVKQQKRENRALAATLIVGTLYGVAESVDAAQTNREVNSQEITDIMESTKKVANGLVKNAYFKYGRENEFEADGVAAELLEYIGINPLAMSDALNALKTFSTEMGVYQSTTKLEDTHPAIDDRISQIGIGRNRYDDDKYDKMSARAYSYTLPLYMKINDQNNTLRLINKNIINNTANSLDYYYKAGICIEKNNNKEAILYLKKAETNLTLQIFDVYKLQTNLYIKEKDYIRAADAAKKYKNYMEELSLSYIDDKEVLQLFNSEIQWSKTIVENIKKIKK